MGRWVDIQRAWHDTAVTNCALCGRLVPRRIWLVEFAGRELPFCNEECEGLYRSYWLPKYGGGALTSSPSPIPMGEGSVTSISVASGDDSRHQHSPSPVEPGEGVRG